MSEPQRLSRSLLLPGPLAPLSHFGLTLFRHVAGSGLRYSFYLLGLPLPEVPAVKFIALRPYLDGRALAELLAEVPGGPEVVDALLDPGGSGALPPAARRIAAAAGFHRLRLVLFPRTAATGPRRLPPPETEGAALPAGPGEAHWVRLRAELTRGVRPLGEAFLSELLGSLARREARTRGRDLRPCLPLEAWRLRRGRKAPLALFGSPDPLLPSWAETPGEAERALAALSGEALAPPHRLRGRFRIAYRAALDRLGPLYRALAQSAAERGLLAAPEDAFFLPFDLAGDLALPSAPAWVRTAAAGNRREHEAARRAAEPAEVWRSATTPAAGERPEWAWAPLLPLP